jgi:CDP-4-dehydro-6-deoxyglucose reductase, E1
LGTFSAFGTYSFYYSHHITTGEGGMVVCQTLEDYDLLRCLRAHGWSRILSNRTEVEERHSDIDPRFLFVNVGYNLRPMEVQAAMGLCQMKRVDRMNQNRIANRSNLIDSLVSHPRWNDQFEFTRAIANSAPSWFGFPALLREDLVCHLRPFLNYLSARGIENRPIVSGNFTRQPGLELYGVKCNPLDYPGAERVHQTGFFIGVHTDLLEATRLAEIADALLGYDFSALAG